MCQGFLLQDILYPCSFCLGALQEFPSGRNIFKNVPYYKSGSVGSAYLRKILLHSAVYFIMGSHHGSRSLADELHP